MAPNLRNGDRNIYLIGSERHQITGCKLPSNRQVLSVLFYNLHEVKLSIRESANLVVRECLTFWEKTRSPRRATPHCVEKIMKMCNHWRYLQKSACRRSETQEENERNFISDLNYLFDIAHANALEIIKIEEDRKLLLSQRESGRRGCLMGIDMKLVKRKERVLLRVKEQENRLAKAHHSSEIDDNFMDSSEESSGTEGISDQLGPSSNITQSSLEANINAQIELRMGIVREMKCFLTPKIMAVLDRLHISQRSAIFILEAVAESLGHNADELAINQNRIQRYREDFRKTKATRIKELFKENESSFVCFHWDGKLLPVLNVRDLKSERLPIIVTYKDEEKLLGMPKLENSLGKEQVMAVWNVLKDWGMEDKAQILCSNATSSNTGRINGAITFLELYADREMTCFPCRKLKKCENINQGISSIALKKSYCLWYLNEESSILTIFDKNVNIASKKRIIENLKRENLHTERKCIVQPNEVPLLFEKAIEDFISQKSLNLLKKLNIDISFLNISPDLWDRDDSHLKSQEIFQNLRVVNDTAERGVKLMQDFNGLLTVDEE
ncbi:hypothetical protein AVEN_96073-1 [Araneus ventricosus]|uniref:Uncharacterized protein n=1 Tax=Araneus ventricosus TaxID=182803 RepID=A0A4Y2B4C6_ARAVE|nr:hypothetical protein AVEN_96073-1 [Araneus ventricosus]